VVGDVGMVLGAALYVVREYDIFGDFMGFVVLGCGFNDDELE